MLRQLRYLALPLHFAVTVVAVLYFATCRRGGVLAFTHYRDLDPRGRDHQMGPLVESLASERRLLEITFVPPGWEVLRNLAVKRRLFVSHVVILAVARLLSWSGDRAARIAARARVTGWIVRFTAPRAAYVIDESGSGQAVVRAARGHGVRSVAVQHGDFRSGNPQYDPAAAAQFDVVPADVLAAWSSWFRDRLLALSPIYTAGNVVVTGRLRHEVRPWDDTREGVAVLVVSEADPAFLADARDFVAELVAADGIEVFVRRHPAEGSTRVPGRTAPWDSLGEALQAVDVVVGRSSSALLEALAFARPVVILGEDIAGFVAAELGTPCAEPGALPALCRSLAGPEGRARVRDAAARVWGVDLAFVPSLNNLRALVE